MMASTDVSWVPVCERLGPPQAPGATAHKIAWVVAHLLQHREAFTAASDAADTRQRREREVQQRTRRANKFGDMLTPVAASQPAPAL
jgi:hypothetical protein